MNGRILHIGNNNNFYKVSLVGEMLEISYKLDGTERTLKSNVSTSDAHWYVANITEDESTVTFTLMNADMIVLSRTSGVKPSSGLSLDSLVRDSGNTVEIGLNSYQGCLEEVRIHGILLPFFDDDTFINNTSKERFMLRQRNFNHGCQRNSGCGTEPQSCANGATCVPDYYTYTCNCSMGYMGRWCQDYMDYCVDASCMNGKCVNTLERHVCRCYPGFTGTR